MSYSKKIARLGVLSAACATLLTLAMPASASQVLLRADLHGTDFIDWGSLGVDGTPVGSLTAISTHLGLDADVSLVAGVLRRQNQGTSWSGNFATGAKLLSTGIKTPREGPISITFTTGLSAIGAQIETRAYSPPDFDGVIAVYDEFDMLLETYTRSGVSVNFADDSAIFLGVARSSADIFRVDFTTNSPTFEFALNRVDLIAGVAPPPPLPEPSGLSLLALGLLGVALRRRRLPG